MTPQSKFTKNVHELSAFLKNDEQKEYYILENSSKVLNPEGFPLVKPC